MNPAKLKDRSPDETIRTTRGLMAEVGLTPIEVSWANPCPSYFSVIVADAVLPIAVNGKGVSVPMALASAMGEFMERLQNGVLVRERFGLMPTRHRFALDESDMSLADVADLQKRTGATLLELPLARELTRGWRSTPAVPFYEVGTGKLQLLPGALLDQAQGSNGMSAGNTPEEALVEAFSEVAERYVMRELICREGVVTPTIPESQIADAELRAMIATLRQAGFAVLVKDCTLGGRLPVVGVVVIDERRERYSVSFGAHPVFERALERTLTELVQGAQGLDTMKTLSFDLSCLVRDRLETPEANRYAEWWDRLRDGRGQIPRAMFVGGGTTDFRRAFLERFVSTHDALAYMTRALLDVAGRIYVRDVSFLGFPSYRVYVPGHSEAFTLNRHALPSAPSVVATLGALLRVPASTTREVAAAAKLLERALRYPMHRCEADSGMHSPFLVPRPMTRPGSRFGEMRPYELLSMLYARTGDMGRAAQHFDRHLRTMPRERNLGDSALKAFLDEAAAKSTLASVRTDLGDIFPMFKEAPAAVIDPKQILDHMRMPTCGDCSRCALRPECCYEDWDRVAGMLAARAAAHPIDQAALGALFSDAAKPRRPRR